jgi:hypothetical protein
MSNLQPNAQEAEAARELAEARFKEREARRVDAPKAIAEYYAAQKAAIDRISGLRAQRLARDEKAPLKHTQARP